jgi:3-oxoacyl-[acyl-carrier-protein] synthase II
MRRVAITGIGTVSSLGLNTATFRDRLLAGECGLGPIGGFACRIGGEVGPVKLGDYVPKTYRKFGKVMARDIELALVAARDAFDSAGLKSKADGEPDFDPNRFGCNIGAGLISADLDELSAAMDAARSEADPSVIDWQTWGREGMNQLTPLWLLKYLPNMLACHVTIVHGLTGPSNNITCAEASGHLSVGEAARAIRRGRCDFAIAGGIESMVNPMGLMRQQLLGRLNTSGPEPDQAVRPFDTRAAGTVASEGGALLILEEFDHARARGATVFAELLGFANAQDTHDSVLPDLQGNAYAAACRNALRQAKLDPGDVDLVVPHGLGIAHHDRSELAGLKSVFGAGLDRPMIAPVKHLLGNAAAGCALDLAAAAVMLHAGEAPAATNSPDPIDTSLRLPRERTSHDASIVLAPIFSLGGQNAAVVLRRG